jgi:hypothetical protein
MTNKTISLAFAIALLLAACNSQKSEETSQQASTETPISMETDIPFSVAKNYFVRNDYKDAPLHLLKITSQADFDQVFGMATTMGANGKPTPIDFSAQYAVACISQTSDQVSSLEVTNLKKVADTILVSYTQSQGEKQSYSNTKAN